MKCVVFGLDQYPNHDLIRHEMLSRMRNHGVMERFLLASTPADLPSSLRFCVIHIDDEQTERAVNEDLALAVSHLADDGIIFVDDFRNFWFPGIASAMYRSLVDLDLRIFATSQGKA